MQHYIHTCMSHHRSGTQPASVPHVFYARTLACALRSLSMCSLQQCSTHPALELFLALLALQLAVRGQLFSHQSSLSTRLHSFHCDLTKHRVHIRLTGFTLTRHCRWQLGAVALNATARAAAPRPRPRCRWRPRCARRRGRCLQQRRHSAHNIKNRRTCCSHL